MELTDLILAFQNEIQKSYDYIHTQAEKGQLFYSFDNVKVEFPVNFGIKEVTLSKEDFQKVNESFRFLVVPTNLQRQIAEKNNQKNSIEGIRIEGNLISSDTKDYTPEICCTKSKLSINFKLIIK